MDYFHHWTQGRRKSLKFRVVWQDPHNHVDDWRISVFQTLVEWTVRNVNPLNIQIWNQHPVPHSNEIPIPVFKALPDLVSMSADEDELVDTDYVACSSAQILFSQEELNDLIREFYSSKESSELLGSRLKDKNLLQTGTNITF